MVKHVFSSLTFRLFFCLVGLTILSLLLVAGLGLRSANNEITEDYDAQLITESIVIWQLTHEHIQLNVAEEYGIGDHIPGIQPMDHEIVEEYAQWRGYRIWKDGKNTLQSDNIDDLPRQPALSGFSNIKVGKEIWRTYSLHVPKEHMVVESFENLRNRHILQHDILMGIIIPELFSLPLLALLLYFGIRYGLRHLYVLARRVETRAPDDLTGLDHENAPIELKPLVGSLNQLFGKLQVSMALEREFIDHAAHELRTPLAALKLQAQLIARSLPEKFNRSAVDELLLSVNRTSRLVDQLLQLSRLPHQEIQFRKVDLFEVVKEAMNLHAIHALDKRISLELVQNDRPNIQSQHELLVGLLSIILENSIKYTPQNGNINITIDQINRKASIILTDTGPGIPEHERNRVFERFYRSAETDQPGSGLGLAIASQIAKLLGVQIDLQSPENKSGLIVVITFTS